MNPFSKVKNAISKINPLDLSNTPTRPVIQTGRVLYSNPSIGYYDLLPDSTVSGVDGTIRALDAQVYSNYQAGISVSNPYPIGTSVLYYTFSTNSGEPVPRMESVIIGTDKQTPIVGQVKFPAWNICNDDLVISEKTDIVQTAYLESQDLISVPNKAYGAPSDIGPGDYVIAGALKNHVYVGYGVTSVSGNYNNNLSFFTESDGCVFSTGTYYIHDNILGREEVYADAYGDATSVKQCAYTISEGFGALDFNQPFKRNTDPNNLDQPLYDQQETGQFPVYRYQELTGAICAGKSTSISGVITGAEGFNITSSEKDILKNVLSCNESSQEPKNYQYALNSIRTGWDGSVAVNSLHSISLDKDYYIPYATQIATEANTFLEKPDDSAGKVLADTYSSIKGELLQYATQAASPLYEYSKLGVVRRFFNRVLQRVKAWKIWDFKTISDKLALKEKKLPLLAINQPCYVPEWSSTVDPIAKQAELLAALSAFIHIAPSGAIVISDGHGAEIRLEGGNITLSPAGDLKILPGRDVIGIVPGKTEYVSKNRIDLASDNGLITIKAENEMQLVSQQGVIALESMSDEHLIVGEEDSWVGAGIILKSGSDLSCTGKNINLRVQQSGDTAEGRTDVSDGGILIDSNKSPICLYGNTIVGKGESSVVLASDESAISLSSALQLAGSTISLPGVVCIGGSKTSLKLSLPLLSSEEIDIDTLDINMGKGSLVVDGNMLVNGSLLSKAAEFETFGAKQGRIEEGVIDNASWLSGIKPGDDAEALNIPLDKLKEASTAVSEQLAGMEEVADASSQAVVNMCAFPMYQAKSITAVSLKYPKTEDYYATEFFIMPSRWQRNLESDVFWGEPNLVNKTMIFPGAEKWTQDDCVYQIVAEGYSKDYTYNDMFNVDSEITYTMESMGPLSKAYKINSEG